MKSPACPPPSLLPHLGKAAFALALAAGPSSQAFLPTPAPEPDSGPAFSLLGSPSNPLRLSESWTPPTPSHWITDSVFPRRRDDNLLGDLVEKFFGAIHLAVPDASAVGVTSEKVVNGISGVITSVQVRVQIAPLGDQPMFNGDFHVTLSHDSGYAVLLNRAGRRDGFSAGYGDSGFDVTFSDLAAADIHSYRIQATGSETTPLSLTDEPAGLTGTWQPDGRSADPSQVLATSPRDAMLDSFAGLSPNGVWTLHVADLSPNGLGQLVEWSLGLTVIPEPGATGVVAFLGLGLLAFARFRSRT
ncbi:MAG: proprotein convertase P-domain-containing protein [Limisphaerales bacterium]